MQDTPDFDVIITGGGSVGLALACALAQNGLRPAIIEAKPAQAESAAAEEFDFRVFSLTLASVALLRSLGAWQRLSRANPFRRIEAWEDASEICFDSADIAEPELGYIVEQRALQAALEAVAAELEIAWLRPARLAALETEAGQVRLCLQDGRAVTAKLAVGADGGHSRLRELAGIACDPNPYGHHAITASVTTELPHRDTSRQRFLPSGPLAFLPLPEPHASSIVWSAPPPHIEFLMQLPEAEFNQQLTAAFAARLGQVTASSPRHAFPLIRRHARHYVQPRLALAGDAAHTIHPLAGQGVNLGLMDVAVLTETLLQAGHRDIGDLSVLRRYERARKGDTQAMLALMDGFRILFGNSIPPLRWLRGAGLSLAGALWPLKRQMILYAAGLGGDLPELVKRGRST
jgi:2-octaprenylphenol hydroxylase